MTVLAFDSEICVATPRLVPANSDNIQKLQAWINALQPSTLTNYRDSPVSVDSPVSAALEPLPTSTTQSPGSAIAARLPFVPQSSAQLVVA